jgi:hypothetical protein
MGYVEHLDGGGYRLTEMGRATSTSGIKQGS